MFSQPSIFGGVYDRLDFNILSIIVSALQTCKSMSNEITATEIFVQQNSLRFLDLAFHSPRTTSWRIYAKTIVHECFPMLTREFFLAERVALKQKLSGLYEEVIQYNEARWKKFEVKHLEFFCELIPQFEDKLFTQISSKDSAEKKRIMHKYLRAYEKLPIDRFDARYTFLVYHCTNPPLDCELTVHMLRTVCDLDYRKIYALSLPPDKTSLETLICHARDMRFDFWGMWRESNYLRHQFDFVAEFLYLRSTPGYAIILLKFGFPYLATMEGFVVRWTKLRCVRYDERPVVRTLQPLLDQALRGHKTRVMLIMDTFTIFGDFIRKGDIEDCVQTLVYLTRCLPEPYVTPCELYFTMKKVVVPEFLPHLHAIAQKYSEAAVFENKHRTDSPRLLMHLCRVVIRRNLASNFKLLNGIEELNIPELMKSYLKLEL